MRGVRRIVSVALSLLILSGALIPAASAEAPSVSLTVLFTHDTHDHFYPDAEGRGGYTRLAALLKQQRETPSVTENGSDFRYPTVTLDGGDFSMGSLFQTIYTTDAPELRALGAMGYDVTTLGNHEFDYRGKGLADMLRAAKASGDPLPEIVNSNYRPDFNGEDTEAKQAMADAMEAYPVTPYTILEKEDGVGLDGRSPMRIAVFGIMGKESHEYAPMSGMALEDPIESARRTVAQIEADGGADFVICLSHSGTEKGKGEDYALAEAVEGIDLIISGHSHTVLSQPIQVKDTYIVSCGEYTGFLGRITLSKKVSPDHELSAWDYRLIPVDDSLPADLEMTAMAREFERKVEESYLADYGLKYHQQLTCAAESFTIEETGNLIGDAYIAAVKAAEGDRYVPVDFAVAPSGVIRDNIRSGAVTTSQAFDILSLGSGADGTPGYPLISVYLTGEDLKNAFEVDASVSVLMEPATLYGAGMYWTWNPNRMMLDRVVSGVQVLEDGTAVEIDDQKLYRVIADLYTGQMLGTVAGKSFGILEVTPRDENGVPVSDLEQCILRNESGKEIKSWYALASYLKQQNTVEPSAARKTAQPSWNPIALLSHPGTPTLAVLALGVLVILAVICIGRAIRRRSGRKKPGGSR